jgi:hypothetical protein
VEICVQLTPLGSAGPGKIGWMGVSSLTVSWGTSVRSYDWVGGVEGDVEDGPDDVKEEWEEEMMVEDVSATASDAAGDTDDAEVSHDAVRWGLALVGRLNAALSG